MPRAFASVPCQPSAAGRYVSRASGSSDHREPRKEHRAFYAGAPPRSRQTRKLLPSSTRRCCRAEAPHAVKSVSLPQQQRCQRRGGGQAYRAPPAAPRTAQSRVMSRRSWQGLLLIRLAALHNRPSGRESVRGAGQLFLHRLIEKIVNALPRRTALDCFAEDGGELFRAPRRSGGARRRSPRFAD